MTVITAEQAAELVEEGQTLVTSGYIGAGFPEHLVVKLGERFRRTGRPGDLTLVHAAGQGDWRDRGLSHLAVPGMLRRVIGGYFATCPALCDLIAEDLVEAYTFPQGVITQLFRNTAAGKPGVFTHIGLGTFVDPRFEGGKANEVTTENLVELVELGGRELLFYPSLHLDVAFIRATTGDLAGNLSYEREAATLEHLSIAQATRRCGGTVIAQVERLAQPGSLDPRRVKVPGNLVDHLVVAPPEHHWQTFAEPFNPAYTGDIKAPFESAAPGALPLGPDKVMARRAALEMQRGQVVNMYHGRTEALANVALEEGLLDEIELTVAAGAVGGMPAGGLSYGLALNPEAIIDQASMFDFYHGGGLDLAVLPMLQVDREGNVNATRTGRTLLGCGSFVDISQSAKRLVFIGTHTVGARMTVEDGQLVIMREGRARRFVESVDQISFSAAQARSRGQHVLYVTERAVFWLGQAGLVLLELAPGVEFSRDVLGQMGFVPRRRKKVTRMKRALFLPGPMREQQPVSAAVEPSDRLSIAPLPEESARE
jgi:propionate CoA-transferase